MTEQTPASQSTGSNSTIAIVLAIYLIGQFLWNVFVPAHEYAMRTEQLLTIGLNVLAVVGLFGMKAKVPQPLFWPGLMAGIGLLALRFTSDAAWWTGHLFYSLR